jgi:NAD(P)-dependent dehydrogenase (short-subunit alcohol dehydrogenase family)
MGQLNNKIALITGGSSGIGLATAQRFLREGAQVIITGRNPDTLAEADKALEGRATVIRSDAADPAAVDALLDDVKAKFGRIDVLFLNAGIAHFAPLEAQDRAGFQRMLDINLLGPYFTVQKALPLLSQGASVLFNTSVVNVKGMPNASAYAATKAALRVVVRGLAAELAARGVRVNAVSPGPIATPIFSKTGMPAEQLDAFAQQIQASVPLGRFGNPSEIANAALFLASNDASFITGTELQVDGGMAQV